MGVRHHSEICLKSYQNCPFFVKILRCLFLKHSSLLLFYFSIKTDQRDLKKAFAENPSSLQCADELDIENDSQFYNLSLTLKGLR